MTSIQQTMEELRDMADFNNFGKIKCRGCGNYCSGHSPDNDGIHCEYCGTKNFTSYADNCTIVDHHVTDDGNACHCGYFKKA